MAYIVCYRSGEAEVVARPPPGTAVLAGGRRRRLEVALSVVARHGTDGRTLLVPGLPEADDDDQAVAAVERCRARLMSLLLVRPRQKGGT